MHGERRPEPCCTWRRLLCLAACAIPCVQSLAQPAVTDGNTTLPNGYQVVVASSGQCKAPPTLLPGTAASAVVAVAPGKGNATQMGVVAVRGQSVEWQNFNVSCDPGANAPHVVAGAVYQACILKPGMESSADAGVVALDQETGEQQWRWSLPTGAGNAQPHTNVHVVASSPEFIFVSTDVYASETCQDGAMRALNASNGAEIWRIAKPSALAQSVLHKGVIYVGFHCGVVMALDMATGAVKWTVSWGGQVPMSLTSTALRLHKEVLYVGMRGALRALDLNGREVWTWRLDIGDADIAAGPSLADFPDARHPYIVYATTRGTLTALQARAQQHVRANSTTVTQLGVELWSTRRLVSARPEVPQAALTAPALAPEIGLVFVGDANGSVFELAMQSGEVQQHGLHSPKGPAKLALTKERLFVTRGNTLVSVLLPQVNHAFIDTPHAAPAWRISVSALLLGVDYNLDFFPLQARYTAAMAAAILAIVPDAVSLLTSQSTRAKPHLIAEDIIRTAGADSGYETVSVSKRRLAAEEEEGMIGTMVRMDVVLVPKSGSKQDEVSRTDALALEEDLTEVGARALWDALESHGSESVDLVMPVEVSLVAEHLTAIPERHELEHEGLVALGSEGRSVEAAILSGMGSKHTDGSADNDAGGSGSPVKLIAFVFLGAAVAGVVAVMLTLAARHWRPRWPPWRRDRSPSTELVYTGGWHAVPLPALPQIPETPEMGEMEELAVPASHATFHLASADPSLAPQEVERLDSSEDSGPLEPKASLNLTKASITNTLHSLKHNLKQCGFSTMAGCDTHDGSIVTTLMPDEILALEESGTGEEDSPCTLVDNTAGQVTEAVADLLCDVAARASRQQPQGPSLINAMLRACEQLDSGGVPAGSSARSGEDDPPSTPVMAAAVEAEASLLAGRYAVSKDRRDRTVMPHSVRVTAMEGSHPVAVSPGRPRRAVVVHFYNRHALWENDRQLQGLPQLRSFFQDVLMISNDDAGGGWNLPPYWKVVAGGVSLRMKLDEERLHGQGMNVKDIARVLFDVAQQLEMLHGRGYLHGCVCVSNIWRRPSSHRWALVDLCHACKVDSKRPTDLFCISTRIAAPEVLVQAEEGLADLHLRAASDMWQLGLLAWELATAAPLFPATCPLKDVVETLAGRRTLPFETDEGAAKLSHMPEQLKDVLLKLLTVNASERPSANSIRCTLAAVLGEL